MTTATLDAAPATVAADTLRLDVQLGELLAAVKSAGVGYSTRPAVPILAFARFDVEAYAVTVSCYDYERHGAAEFVTETPGFGSFLLPYKQLLDLLTAAGKVATKRVSDRWMVSFVVTETVVLVTVNGASFRLTPGPLDEFPPLPDLDAGPDTQEIFVDTAEFIRVMDAALSTASTDGGLPVLCSIRLEAIPGQLSVISTDRYRLAKADMAAFGTGEWSATLPSKVWKAARKHLNKKISTVIRFHNDGSGVGAGRVSIHNETVAASAAVDGDYPRVRSLFPDNPPIRFEVDEVMFTTAVKAVVPMIERNMPVLLEYARDGHLTARSPMDEDGGQAASNFPYTLAGDPLSEPFKVGFNPGYLLDALKVFKGRTITVSHTEAHKPAVFEAVGDESVSILIMPVRHPSL